MLAALDVHFDTWFSERSLVDSGAMEATLDDLRARGVVDEADGAVWLRSTEFGDDKDRVLVRSDGEPTYLLPDIAYHRDKFARGFDLLIDVWGADHHGYVPRMKAAMQAVGHDPAEFEVSIVQLMKLMRGGEAVRISKRTGDIVELREVIDEVGPDAARLTFLLQSIDSPQTFDLDVVTSQAMENPVFYVQMAHARLRSIERRAAEQGVARLALGEVDLGQLAHERELDVLRGPVHAARRAGHRLRRPGPASHHHLGARAGRRGPRLLPRLLRARRRHRPRADPGAAVAGRGGRDRPGHRAGPARGGRPRVDVSQRVPDPCCPTRPRSVPTGHLIVGGCDTLELAAEFGTPLFVYDEAQLRARCAEAVAGFGPGVSYATKAFLCRAMARLAAEAGMHLDVSTGGEYHVARAAGTPPDRLVLHGNNKSSEELRTAHGRGRGPHRRRLLRRARPHRGAGGRAAWRRPRC